MKPLIVHRNAEDVVAEARKHPAIANLPAHVIRLLVTLGSAVALYSQARAKGVDLFDVEFITLQLHDLAHRELHEAGIDDHEEHHRIMQAVDKVIGGILSEAVAGVTKASES